MFSPWFHTHTQRLRAETMALEIYWCTTQNICCVQRDKVRRRSSSEKMRSCLLLQTLERRLDFLWNTKCSSTMPSHSLFKPHTGLNTSPGIQIMLLFQLLLWDQGIWGMLKNKCPLTLQRDLVDPKNRYRPGEVSIGGIISATQATFKRLNFKKSPLTQVLG